MPICMSHIVVHVNYQVYTTAGIGGGGAKYVSMDGPTYYPYIRLNLCIT